MRPSINGRRHTALTGALGWVIVLLLLPLTPAAAITEAEFIEKVLAQDKLLEAAQIDLDITRINLDRSYDNHANWKATLSLDLGYQYDDLDRDGNGYPYRETEEDYPMEVKLALEKKFLSNPGHLKAGVGRSMEKTIEQRKYKNHEDYHKNSDDREEEYETWQYIDFNYPLLKHGTTASSLKTYRRNLVQLQQEELDYYETKEDFLADRLGDYLRWVLYQQQVIINHELLAQLRPLHPRDEQEAALLTSAVFQIEDDNSEAENRLRSIKERLSVLLDDRAILEEVPHYDLQKRTTLVTTDDLHQYLSTQSRRLQDIAMDLRLKQLDIDHYKNRNLPQLDFDLSVEREASGGVGNYDDNEITYEASLTLRIPLGGNATDRANLDTSHLKMRGLEIDYQEILQDMMADVHHFNSALTVDEARLRAAVEAAVHHREIQRRDYRDGHGELRDLLDAYKDERVARLDSIDSLIEYHLNRIEYDNLLDRMIETPCAPLSPCAY